MVCNDVDLNLLRDSFPSALPTAGWFEHPAV